MSPARRRTITLPGMSTDVSSYSSASPAPHSGAARAAAAALGILAAVLGIVLLFHPYTAARTLALLVGLALVLGGVLELAVGDTGRRWTSILVGAVLVIGGVLAAFWPSVTLKTVAVITGLVLILHGVVRLVLAVVSRHQIPGWGWLAFAGVVNIAVGILAIAWPEATILVLSLLLGAQILVFGVVLTVAAFAAGRGSPRRPAMA